jgi:hypothetical protein
MTSADFYKVKKPTKWATVPDVFSYSSLNAIKRCPLQWQLAHSKYGDDEQLFPFRPAPSAVEGDIVHTILERLFRALSLQGLPKLGSPDFRECIQHLNAKKTVEGLVKKHKERIAAHPRGNGFRLRLTSQQLTNKVIRIFRQQYPQVVENGFDLSSTQKLACQKMESDETLDPGYLLNKYGLLSEYKLKHPNIPFVGVLDFVCLDNGQTVIVDFKTGKQDEDHLRQLLYYAILWWRASGQVPNRIEVRYPGNVESFFPTKRDLKNAERELASEIAFSVQALSMKPAKPSLGDHCNFCDVRQFCESYWLDLRKISFDDFHSDTMLDLEIVVSEQPSDYGFDARTFDGEGISVVFRRETACIQSPFIAGERIRILGAFYKCENGEIELKPWSEVFRV